MPARNTHSLPILSIALCSALLLLVGTVAPADLQAQLLSPDTATERQVETQFETQKVLEAAPIQATSDAIALTAIPPRLGDDGGLLALPGETIQESIRVRNTGDSPIQFNSNVQDFVIGEDGQTPIAVSENVTTRWSLADWIVLAPQTDTLQPGETAQIAVVIEVPDDALPGGHYAMITHQPSAGRPDGQTASAVNQRVGTLVYLTVEGPINEEAFIRNLNIPSFVEYGPVPFSLEVDNQSDIHITPTISVDIHNFLGKRVETITLESKNIFPFSTREFVGQWDRVWGMGPYTAKVTMNYGNQGRVTLATERFWLMPASLVAAGIVSLLALIVIIIAVRRHLDHRNDGNRKRVEMLEQQLNEMRQGQMNQQMNSQANGTQNQDENNTPPYQKYQ